ncbi:MAG: bifunctional diaminohydroxyphosphoribosylaminopyrimidine deaminase/5-amino-6-(5-phosphoribosylamino)uracil reductase RibD, partial [Bdellovibrionaceae bacterium]|nr:bifunctional diaminohydroxyphosphoribosylaminopyrimidine deaminase/5-amino-6-(5-phosphoribosylamino)uracil reductase RibD [Pseudobdellovibrionaceae bacterium]
TVYVTLEPCSHQGKTPPCADRLIRDRVGKVVIGVMDPNPLVAGQGIDKLEKAGIEVVLDPVFALSAQRVGEQFLWNMRKKLPFVTLKLAMSLDGKLALKNGESQWITGEPSRELARVFRAHHDATLVGAQTVLSDNPTLDFRGTKYAGKKQNKILIWDPKNKVQDFLPTSNLAKAHSLKNIQVLSNIDVSVLQSLYEQGITSIYVEGGAQTLSTFIEQKLFQKMYVFVAPILLGNGLDWTSSINLTSMTERQELEIVEATPVYKDILLTVYPKNKN